MFFWHSASLHLHTSYGNACVSLVFYVHCIHVCWYAQREGLGNVCGVQPQQKSILRRREGVSNGLMFKNLELWSKMCQCHPYMESIPTLQFVDRQPVLL